MNDQFDLAPGQWEALRRLLDSALELAPDVLTLALQDESLQRL